MKTVGIVAEYNPFHNGHLYHLETARSLTGADCVVVVMSGNFTQRGEPAVVDKWARAEMALLAGADLVIELPAAYAMGSAEFFAFGAVKLLDSLGAVDAICFGSEAGTLEYLSTAAKIFTEEPEEYRATLKKLLSDGISFPAARQKALSHYIKSKYGKDPVSSLLKSSNNILGVEYLKALYRLNSRITPFTTERIGGGYNSTELSGKFSSATAIRNIISSNQWQCARKLIGQSVPSSSLTVLEREIGFGRGPIFPSDFEGMILSLLRRSPADVIKNLPYMEDGLENRFASAAEKAGTLEELMELICTRRYTATRIQRILFSLLIGLDSEKFERFNSTGGPAYIRVLGFSRTGRRLLSEIRGKTALPVITRAAGSKNTSFPCAAEMLALEAAASDQYVLAFKNSCFKKAGSDFTHNVINNDISSKPE